MPSDLLVALAPYAATAVSLVAALLVYRASVQNAKASPYSVLADRVVKLESRVDDLEARNDLLEAEQGEDRTLIKRLLDLLERHQIDVPSAWLPSWLRRPPTTPPTLD